jgi:hypothetical protein
MSSFYILEDGGEILGIFLEKQEKVSRVQDGCPIKNVGHDKLTPSSPKMVSGDPSERNLKKPPHA